jgi:hypothetical protein
MILDDDPSQRTWTYILILLFALGIQWNQTLYTNLPLCVVHRPRAKAQTYTSPIAFVR